jgi:hypothetical protein
LKKIIYLAGTVLEFSGGLNGKGFVLIIQMQPEHVVGEFLSLILKIEKKK